MAQTPDGRKLTESHRALQRVLGEIYGARVAENFSMLDMLRISETTPIWVVETHATILEGYWQSAAVARDYLEDFRIAEAGSGRGPLVSPRMGSSFVVDELADLAGRLHDAMESGLMSPEEAAAFGRSMVERYGVRHVLNGGRNTVMATANRDPNIRGWRRVSDGRPCAFCAMLVGRGPVYKDETVGFRAHPDCGCTAEPSYQTFSQWEDSLTVPEQEWREAYFEAAGQADAADGKRVAPTPRSQEDTILWRMRRNRPTLFNDGVTKSAD